MELNFYHRQLSRVRTLNWAIIPLKLKTKYVSSFFKKNLKYVILSMRQVRGGIYAFQEFFGAMILRHKSLSLGDLFFDC